MQSNKSGESARASLISAGIALFGTHGFDATSTREIAAAAGANIAAIAYHFGGKNGLRLACAAAVAERMGAALKPLLQGASIEPDSPQAAEAALSAVVDTMIGFIVVSPEAQAISRFVLREQMERSPAFDIIFDRLFEPAHQRICVLWATATGGRANSVDTRLATLSLLGQIVYFRAGRSAVLRRMGWGDIGPREARAIGQVIKRTLSAAIRAVREGARP